MTALPVMLRAERLSALVVGGGSVAARRAGALAECGARVRDAIAARFDDRYASAVRLLGDLRRRLLDAGSRDQWQRASSELVGADFCDAVETGEQAGRIERWR